MIHVSTSCNACFHTTGAHYLNADTTAFMQCLTSDLFKQFPTLKFLIPHGGGAVPYHWGRFRGLAQELKKPLLEDHLLNNIYFDTCVYHQPVRCVVLIRKPATTTMTPSVISRRPKF
jgi:4-oxalmesaconate hydratase